MSQRRVSGLHTFSNVSRFNFRAVEKIGSFVSTGARSVEIEDGHTLGIENRFFHLGTSRCRLNFDTANGDYLADLDLTARLRFGHKGFAAIE